MRRSRRVASAASAEVVEPVEPVEPVQSTQSVRTKRKASDDPVPIEDWQQYISEDTLRVYYKQVGPKVEIPYELLADDEDREALVHSWEYQYVLSWLYNVCESFRTQHSSIAEYIIDTTGPIRTYWKDLKFDENLLWIDFHRVFPHIRLNLLKNVANNKSITMDQWDELLENHVGITDKFDDMRLPDQFNVLYRMIKFIEARNLPFRNYLSNYLDLFDFYHTELDEHRYLIALPAIGVLIERQLTRDDNDKELAVPIKLKNCTVQNKTDKSIELIHLDYSKEIDDYMHSVKFETTVLTTDFESFLEYWRNHKKNKQINEFCTSMIPDLIEHILYASKSMTMKEKEDSLAELMTRRKRSSRLVAKEKEVEKEEEQHKWLDKVTDRDQFIKHRNRVVGKFAKKVKDVIRNEIWYKFEQELKTEKLRRRNDPRLNTDSFGPSDEDPLGPMDWQIINDNPVFKENVVSMPPSHITDELKEVLPNLTELPSNLCITNEDIEERKKEGLPTDNEQLDIQDWLFDCPGETEPVTTLVSHEKEPEDPRIVNHSLVCCAECFRWQHWAHQPSKITEILTYASLKPSMLNDNIDHQLTEKDLAAVSYASTAPLPSILPSRRSVRARTADSREESREPEVQYNRPVDKRKPLGEFTLFVCGWCMENFESSIRSSFIPELQAIRLKQKKQFEYRMKKKREKEELKKAQAQLSNNDSNGNTSSFKTKVTNPTSTIDNGMHNSFATHQPVSNQLPQVSPVVNPITQEEALNSNQQLPIMNAQQVPMDNIQQASMYNSPQLPINNVQPEVPTITHNVNAMPNNFVGHTQMNGFQAVSATQLEIHPTTEHPITDAQSQAHQRFAPPSDSL